MRNAGRCSVLSVALLTLAWSAAPGAQTRHESPASPDINVFRDVAREHNPAVVAIRTTTWVDSAASEEAEWFERLFGRTIPRGPRPRHAAASGFLISPEGDILTNDHVVANAAVIEVRLFDQSTRTYRATVVGRDPVLDTAVIRLEHGPSNLPVAALGDSDSLRAGDWVMAIGNPYQLGHSVTVGVVSYVGRSIDIGEGRWHKLIQTDASINPGSSGGPMLNSRGEVIGINLATLADGLGDKTGIAFAIPINSVKAILPALRAGRVARGTIGVQLRHEALDDNDARALGLHRAGGALVVAVDRGSSAETAGLRPGDVIVEFFGAPVATADDVLTRMWQAAPGANARVRVVRDGRPKTVDVIIEELRAPLSPRRPDLDTDLPPFGLILADPEPGTGVSEGAMVDLVEDGSAAALAGVEPGDVIRKINTHPIRDAADAQRALQHLQPGCSVFLLVRRDGQDRIVELEYE